MKRRIRGICISMTLVLAALGGRLYYIQAVCGEELADGAGRQQTIEIHQTNQRGTIYDRNLVPLTDRCSSCCYLIREDRCDEQLQKLMASAGGERAGRKGSTYTVYRTDRVDQALSRRLIREYGAYVFSIPRRYEEEQTAVHLIGYISGSDGTGQAGLEKMYQYRLASASASFSMTGDGSGAPVAGIGLKQQSEEEIRMNPSALVTTIDSTLQKKTEEILKKRQITGAAVVMDVETGQILAMASTPVFNPLKVERYLNSDEGELMNKAVQGQYPPGSVFKIVVAAAALESGCADPSQTFTCTGETTVNGVRVICESCPEGHGELNMGQALAKSCNCYFAKLGQMTGSEIIVETAEKMGLGREVLDGFPGEETGCFPSEEERAYSGISNLSLGQGGLLVTPVQVARMTAVIASGGICHEGKVVMSQAGQEDCGNRVITEETAAVVGEMMEQVFSEGTAGGSRLCIAAAGKTGSAEAGSGDSYRVHGWFTGYFPADSPRYAVTVFAENGKTGSGSALPVFEDIASFLYG
ncbi:MAG: peptidoglycan D,D-transpeptidase FtsI family protein [Emergencia sp.]